MARWMLMRKDPSISTVSNGVYPVISSKRHSIAHHDCKFNWATQDDPRPTLAVKKKIQWTAPTPWQVSTLTHLPTLGLRTQTNLHTHLITFTSHGPSTALCLQVQHALAPKRCVSICCHPQRLPEVVVACRIRSLFLPPLWQIGLCPQQIAQGIHGYEILVGWWLCQGLPGQGVFQDDTKSVHVHAEWCCCVLSFIQDSMLMLHQLGAVTSQ